MVGAEDRERLQNELIYGLFLKFKRLVTMDKLLDTQITQLGSYKEIADEYIANIPQKDGVKIGFGFVDSLRLNGVAFRHKASGMEYRFATVNHGAILYFHEFFSYLMSRTDVLPSIGQAKSESNLPLTFQPPNVFPPLLDFAKSGLVTSVNPKDDLRIEFANIMAVKASEFLIKHEIAHCTNGHVSYARFALNETDSPVSEPPDEVLLRHTLEMDADAIAANEIFNHAFSDLQTSDDFKWSEELSSFPPNKFLYPTLIAIHLAFRLFARPGTLPLQENEFLAGTHPHPLVRAHFFRVTGVEIAMTRLSTRVGEWLSQLTVKAAIDAETIWSQVTGIPSQPRFIVFDNESPSAGLEKVSGYMHQLLDYWHEVRPRLQDVAIVGLALSKHQISTDQKVDIR